MADILFDRFFFVFVPFFVRHEQRCVSAGIVRLLVPLFDLKDGDVRETDSMDAIKSGSFLYN